MSDPNHAGHPARSWVPGPRHPAVLVPLVDIPQTDIHPWWACLCDDCEDARRLFTHGHLQVKR